MKNNIEQYKRIIRYGFIIMLFGFQSVAFLYSWIVDYNNYIVLPFVEKGNWLVFLYYVILQFIFFYNFDGLKLGYFKKSNLIISQTLALICTNVMTYIVIALLSARFVTVLPLLYVFLTQFAFSFLVTLLSEFIFNKCFPPKKLLIIYEDYAPELMIQKMKTRKDKYIPEKLVHVSVGMDEIEKMLDSAESVVVFDVHAEIRNKILKLCFEKDIRAYSTSKVSDTLIRGAETVHLFDTPLLLFRNNRLSFEQRVIKRTCDIIISLLLLIIFSPFMLIAAIAIKLYDGGPVFFRQERSTIDNTTFRIHKFRSMIVDAEKDGFSIPATEKDPRITPVGRILRATRLDELPQLIDVLKGDMSLVGPRPERIEHTKKYTEEIPEFTYRLKVKGGLTGLAQLYGKYNTSPYDKLQLDLMYIQNYSLLLDIKLLFMTVKIMFMKESTEGFTEENSKKMGDTDEKN